jgi:hypothetical protein
MLIAVVGWLGAGFLLLAYGLTSVGRLPPEGGRFQTLNLTGALALTVNIWLSRPGRSSIGLLLILAGLPFYRHWSRTVSAADYTPRA